MIGVASLELCKELDELTSYKWHHETQYRWYCLPKLIHKGSSPEQDYSSWQVKHLSYRGQYRVDWYGAYDLGYLLRKLPPYLELGDTVEYHSVRNWLYMSMYEDGKEWQFGYTEAGDEYYGQADTPENAAAKLCIELFKQGVLKR
jgi:hypothetical protein